ncbi:MAG: L-serine ammonia-lyase, iron-sulfur-dependent, subunit alpha [Deltaproteobacteria bacterium]
MNPVSVLNDVLGPVIRGPSSSHTAAPFFIGKVARALLDDEPASVTFAFDPKGSFAQVFRQQGSDLGFASGLMGLSLTDEKFSQSLELAAQRGVEIRFSIEPLPEADHPNTVEIRMASRSGRELSASAESVGGGAFRFTRLDRWPVLIAGNAHELLIELKSDAEPAVVERVAWAMKPAVTPHRQVQGDLALLHFKLHSALDSETDFRLRTLPGVCRVWTVPPVFFSLRGEPLFESAAEMTAAATTRSLSLGETALAYEARLLGISEQEVMEEILKRFDIMKASVHRGLEETLPGMRLLRPSARSIFLAEAEGRLAVGGIHTRAGARAMAVMHINSGGGVVCTAPTAGSAGVIPGVVVSLVEDRGLTVQEAGLGLCAASAIGVIVANRATFAAEVAGCQVEIAAAGAMAAAAVVETAGGSAAQAVDAAAISFQNTMGLVCDPVQGAVEIPCHTRNAVAASSAFVCADLIFGGYVNPVPLDETIDAVYAVGRMLPAELRCTALGGLSLAPSALKMSSGTRR